MFQSYNTYTCLVRNSYPGHGYIWKVIVDKNAQVGSTPFFSLRPRILDRVSVIVDR